MQQQRQHARARTLFLVLAISFGWSGGLDGQDGSAERLLGEETANTAGGPGAFSITVDNHGYSHLRVYVVRGGVSRRLGTAPSGHRTQLRANCRDFTNRKTDFLLRPLGGRATFVRGEVLAGCDQSLRIEVLPIGLEFTRLWIE